MIENAKGVNGKLVYQPVLLPDGVSNYSDKKAVISNAEKYRLLIHQYNSAPWRRQVVLETMLLESGEPSKIVSALKILREKNNQNNIIINRFVLSTSAETVSSMHRWSEIQEFSQLCSLVIFDRTESNELTYDYARAKEKLSSLGFSENYLSVRGSFSQAIIKFSLETLSSSYVRQRILYGDFSKKKLFLIKQLNILKLINYFVMTVMWFL